MEQAHTPLVAYLLPVATAAGPTTAAAAHCWVQVIQKSPRTAAFHDHSSASVRPSAAKCRLARAPNSSSSRSTLKFSLKYCYKQALTLQNSLRTVTTADAWRHQLHAKATTLTTHTTEEQLRSSTHRLRPRIDQLKRAASSERIKALEGSALIFTTSSSWIPLAWRWCCCC